MTSGAPILVNSELFPVEGEPAIVYPSSAYPVATAAIAAETKERMDEMARRRPGRQGPPPG